MWKQRKKGGLYLASYTVLAGRDVYLCLLTGVYLAYADDKTTRT